MLKDKLEGIGWYTYEICRRMVLDHPEDHFYFLFDRPYDSQFIFAENVTPVVLFPPARHPILFYIWFEHAVHRFLKKNQMDAFFSPDGFLSLKTKVPTYLTIHDIAYKHFPDHVGKLMLKYYQIFMPRFVQKAHKIFTVSKYSKSDIINSYQLNPLKVEYFYNGCRAIFQPLKPGQKDNIRKSYTQGQPYFIYIGSVHPRKNIERVLEAFKLFKSHTKHNHLLVLTGRFAWKSRKAQQLMYDAQLKNHIVFTGTVSDEELVLILGSSTALVYPSLFEGFGMPILEAMQCNIPVITSNTSSMPEVGGDAVHYVDPYSVHEIADAMKKMIEDKENIRSMIAKGRKQLLKFSWEEAAKKVYSSISNRKQ